MGGGYIILYNFCKAYQIIKFQFRQMYVKTALMLFYIWVIYYKNAAQREIKIRQFTFWEAQNNWDRLCESKQAKSLCFSKEDNNPQNPTKQTHF